MFLTLAFGGGVRGALSSIAVPAFGGILRWVMSTLIGALGGVVVHNTATGIWRDAIEDARARTKEKVETKARGRGILFHYTDRIAAQLIAASSCIFASKPYSHPDGVYRRAGAYATPLPPWQANWTQVDLLSVLYLEFRVSEGEKVKTFTQ